MTGAAQIDAAELRTRVSGSSFYAAMRLMPKLEREAMFAIYLFCRLVDDIADDGTRPRPDRAIALAEWRKDLDALYAGRPAGQASFLQGPMLAFGLQQADFLDVIDGMEMDVASDIRAPDLVTLELYCDRVAVAVGRLSTRIFGMDEAPGRELAHHLGRALQLTNVLRDIDEDAAIGRLYLPRELLMKAGIETTDPLAVIGDARVDQACRMLATRSLDYFGAADRLLRSAPRGRLLAPRLMAAVYRALLQRMLAEGWAPPRRRARISKPYLIYLIARCSVFG
ncbi:MAG: presqualene diphosphate synthase HpnD [Reyranellaceae bacterium]